MDKKRKFNFDNVRFSDADVGIHVEDLNNLEMNFKNSEFSGIKKIFKIGASDKLKKIFEHPIISGVIVGFILILFGLLIYFMFGFDINNPSSNKTSQNAISTTTTPCTPITLVESTNPNAVNNINNTTYEGPCGVTVLKGSYASSSVSNTKIKETN